MPLGVTGLQQSSISQLRRISIKTASKHLHSPSFEWRPIKILQDASVESFRRDAFQAQRPVLMPPGHFTDLPAITKWFNPSKQQDGAFELDYKYLEQFGDAVVPLELSAPSSTMDGEDFQRSGLCYPTSESSLQVKLLISRTPLQRLHRKATSYLIPSPAFPFNKDRDD